MSRSPQVFLAPEGANACFPSPLASASRERVVLTTMPSKDCFRHFRALATSGGRRVGRGGLEHRSRVALSGGKALPVHGQEYSRHQL